MGKEKSIMAWSLSPSRRQDIVLEFDELTNTSGAYISSWVETAYIDTVRVSVRFPSSSGGVQIEEGIYASTASEPKGVRYTPITKSGQYAYDEIKLSTRYFRIIISGANSEEPVSASVRAVGRKS
jgi:hypothetical protein